MSFIANLNKAFMNTASIFNGLALLQTQQKETLESINIVWSDQILDH